MKIKRKSKPTKQQTNKFQKQSLYVNSFNQNQRQIFYFYFFIFSNTFLRFV